MKFNPFVPFGIAFPGMFIGRFDEIEAIEQALFQTKNNNPQHLLISGERGIGKSSLLNYADLIARGEINVEALEFNFLTVSTDLAGVQTQGGIVKQIGRELKSKLRSHENLKEKAKLVWEFLSNWEILGVAYRGKEEEIDPDEALDDLVSLFVDISETRNFDGIAVLLDEADTPPVEAGLGEFLKIVTERLAKRGCNDVLFLLAGQSILVQKLRDSHESSLRVFQVLTMQPLEPKERKNVVRVGIARANEENERKTKIDEEATDLLSDLSEGYPHFLQQFCYCAFDTDTDDAIDLKDVLHGASAENGAIDQLGAKYFSEMYYSKIWSDDYRRVLDFMAEHGDGWVARKSIIEGCEVSASNVDNALAALKKREIILADEARKGFYRLPTRSFATWITVVSSTHSENVLQ